MRTNRWLALGVGSVLTLAGCGSDKAPADAAAGAGGLMGGAGAPAANCTGSVQFSDPALRAAVRSAAGVPTADLTRANLASVTELTVMSSMVTSLNGLECVENLTKLFLVDNRITDLAPIAGLVQLTELGVDFNNITDIASLSRLVNLTSLSLASDQVSDLSVLSGMKQLWYLRLSNNRVASLSPLGGLPALKQLYLLGNQVKDVQPLATLPSLNYAYLKNNLITDLSPLLNVPKLSDLDVDVSGNPFDCTAQAATLATLTAMGASVTDSCP